MTLFRNGGCGLKPSAMTFAAQYLFPDLSQFRKPAITTIDMQLVIALFLNIYRTNKL
jgi:hypothetical protein